MSARSVDILQTLKRIVRTYAGTASRKIVLLAVLDHADSNGVAKLGRARLARESGMGVSTLDRTLAALEDEGELAVVRGRRTPAGDADINHYRLLRPAPYRGVASERGYPQSGGRGGPRAVPKGTHPEGWS